MPSGDAHTVLIVSVQPRRTITLPDRHMRVLEAIATKHFHGNVSATLRELLETHNVTKSFFPSSPLATRRDG
jgi:hypothetical protein